MTEDVKIILALTCTLPAVMALVFYKRIDKLYHPLIYILLLTLVTEIANWITLHDTSSLSVNTYIFPNLVFHVWLFYNMRTIKNKLVAYCLSALFGIVVAGNIVYNHSVHIFLWPSACLASIIILVMSIEGITRHVYYSSEAWYKDSFLLFCIINIYLYAYFTFLFTLRFFGLKEDEPVQFVTSYVYYYINASSNILFIWVVICLIQAKKSIK